MRLENSFRVPAPPAEAWALLTDVPRVVPCLPGAELDRTVGADAWKLTLHVKLGPISLRFATDLVREQVDEAAGRVVLAAKAREARGRGGAEATIESRLSGDETGSDVAIVTELELRGAIAQYGRGLVADVASQLTEQFAACLARQLAAPEAAGPKPGERAGESPRPVGALRLGLAAIWRSLLRLGRGGRRGRAM